MDCRGIVIPFTSTLIQCQGGSRFHVFWLTLILNEQVGGVHSHLVARVEGDLRKSGRPVSQQEVMTTVFPMFQQDIEPHLVYAHVSSTALLCICLSFSESKTLRHLFICGFVFVVQLKISNDFDPVHSPESSMFVLKSSKQVNNLQFESGYIVFLVPVKKCSVYVYHGSFCSCLSDYMHIPIM